uniref:hypothetical protein n=1 Tax=Mycolicibacterium conceptionense TaxID=451644 RepID=UPI0019522622
DADGADGVAFQSLDVVSCVFTPGDSLIGHLTGYLPGNSGTPDVGWTTAGTYVYWHYQNRLASTFGNH